MFTRFALTLSRRISASGTMTKVKTFTGFLVLLTFGSSLFPADKSLTLDDLDLKPQETQANTQLQADLNKRSTMLQWHQWLGLAALAPMATTYFLGDSAGKNSDNRNLHAALGIGTAVLYTASATLAILAPKPDGIKDTGSTKFHRWLSYIHLPLMIIVPILGALAKQQLDDGSRRTSGIASLHGAASTTLLVTYSLAVTIMVFNF